MRDDRYKGTSLTGPVRKLCRMAEREADRAHPERLRVQAIAALVSDAERQISPRFRQLLKEHDTTPSLFGVDCLKEAVQSGLETEIVRNIDAGFNPANALCEAFRRRGEGYAREQRCQLVADHHPAACIASESVKRAYGDGAPDAARLILAEKPVTRLGIRVQLNENLLPQQTSGAGT